MAILVIGEATGMTAEEDAAAAQQLYPSGSLPAGFRIRMAGPMDGGWRIVTLWDSRKLVTSKSGRWPVVAGPVPRRQELGAPGSWRRGCRGIPLTTTPGPGGPGVALCQYLLSRESLR